MRLLLDLTWTCELYKVNNRADDKMIRFSIYVFVIVGLLTDLGSFGTSSIFLVFPVVSFIVIKTTMIIIMKVKLMVRKNISFPHH